MPSPGHKEQEHLSAAGELSTKQHGRIVRVQLS